MSNDAKMRELVYRLMEMAPPAPPPADRVPKLRDASRPTRRRSPFVVVVAAAAFVALVVGLPFLISRETPRVSPADQPGSPTTVAPPVAEVPGVVFFLMEPEAATTPGPVLIPVQRLVPEAQGRQPDPQGLLEGLMAGPTDATMSSAIPSGTRVLGVEASGNVLRVDLSAAFAEGGGTLSTQARLAQVVFTATTLAGVERVTFLVEGQEAAVFGSEGLVLEGPQSRDDYLDLLPPVLLESPARGGTLGNPGTLRGLANVFEATVTYEIVAGARTVARGFTTATCGTGCWGEFTADVVYDLEADTAGEVLVFWESPEDGSLRDVLRYPVTLTASPETTGP